VIEKLKVILTELDGNFIDGEADENEFLGTKVP